MHIKNMSKTTKKVYCKHCGNEIDDKTKKCIGCGTQYFRFSKRVFVIAVAGILAIGLIGANVYQYIENKQTVKTLNDKVNSELSLNADLRQQRDAESIKFGSKEIELAFWDKSAVIVTETGKKYHHYGCYHLNDCKSIWIYNIEAAVSRGYTPCLDCCKTGGPLSEYMEQNG